MEVIIQPDIRSVSLFAASLVAQQIRRKPKSVLGLATGGTPIPLYQELIRMHREQHLSFREVITFNLDEYLGLDPNHPASYRSFMHEQLFKHLDLPPCQTHLPDSQTQDVTNHCAQYERAIQNAGGIDLQILGIGSDGHIGFNEPSSSLASRTRIKTLTQKTLDANKRFFRSQDVVPRHVITMGVGTIMEARQCLLLAYGLGKADAVAKMIEGPITAMVPASILQMHPQTTVLLDEAAAAQLQNHAYYRYVFACKPPWQQIDQPC